MQKVYTAKDPLEAHLLKGYLENAGIFTLILGEYLFATRGALPLTEETLPTLWVKDEDREEAALLLQEFLQK